MANELSNDDVFGATQTELSNDDVFGSINAPAPTAYPFTPPTETATAPQPQPDKSTVVGSLAGSAVRNIAPVRAGMLAAGQGAKLGAKIGVGAAQITGLYKQTDMSGSRGGSEQYPTATRDTSRNVAGQIYMTPKGPLKWTGTGWVQI